LLSQDHNLQYCRIIRKNLIEEALMRSPRGFVLYVLTVLIVILRASAQPIGETYVAGTTWYDLQHTGSCGRMIGVDDSGYVHVVWMVTPNIEGRWVNYNRWELYAQQFTFGESGTMISSCSGAGYTTLAVDPSGYAFAAFHCQVYPGPQQPSMIVPVACGTMGYYPPEDNVVRFWPQLARGANGWLHMVTMHGFSGWPPGAIYYSRAIAENDSVGRPCRIEWQSDGNENYYRLLDSATVVAHTIAASRSSARVALGWIHPRDSTQQDNDVYVRISEDGGITWNPRLNITDFVPVDTACLNETHDWRRCDRDTLRAFTDVSLLFDNNDHLRAAFTTRGFWAWSDIGEGPWVSTGNSLIWNWNEATAQFSLVADGWIPAQCGTWQSVVERPSLAIDPTTGYLYCAYLRYDTAQVSVSGYFNADVWISVSTDNGASWSTGTNVTRTRPSVIPAPQGTCMSERDPTLSEAVSGGYLHLSYLLDRDAGCVIYGEGTATSNNFVYQRIPVDSIATTPLMPRYPLHWDSTGFLSVKDRAFIPHPSSFILSAYPNPFNSTATISFELPMRSQVSLKVFDLLGREVQTLHTGLANAGAHTVNWDASSRASGIYFVRMQAGKETRTQKIMLLK
jgi:hypothetical protein